jgi:hypothetical protein
MTPFRLVYTYKRFSLTNMRMAASNSSKTLASMYQFTSCIILEDYNNNYVSPSTFLLPELNNIRIRSWLHLPVQNAEFLYHPHQYNEYHSHPISYIRAPAVLQETTGIKPL